MASKSIFLFPLVAAVAMVGCSQQQDAAQAPSKNLPVLSMDAFLSGLATSARRISTAQTSVLRDDAIEQLTKEARKTLKSARIEAVVTIRDVKITGANKARISVTELDVPSLKASKDAPFNVVLAHTVDLPLSAEQARAIRPGQKLRLRGNADYHPGSVIIISLPRPRAFARLFFRGGASDGAIITLVPTHYSIFNP